MIARVHRPVMHDNGVSFPISVQDPESHYTPRPTQLWIEIVPVVTNAELPKQTYFFYDANYEAKTPVPLVNWHASNWPIAATAADVRIWAKYEPTPNLHSISMKQLQQSLQRYSDGVEVSGIEGVKLTVNIFDKRASSGGLELRIAEIHSDRSRGVGSIRVSLETEQSVASSRITRRFEPANNMAIHTFEFNASNGEELLRSLESRIVIQSRVAAHEGAWQIQAGQPIRVEITGTPETLPQIKLPSLSFPVSSP